jgi:hypothetical protein
MGLGSELGVRTEEAGEARSSQPLILGRARGRISGKGAELQGGQHHANRQRALRSRNPELPSTRLPRERFAIGNDDALPQPLCLSSSSLYKWVA